MKIKQSILAFVICSLFPIVIEAQEYSREYGVISDAEWALETYEKDPEAGAVVLYDIGEARMKEKGRYGLSISFNRRTRIKILKKSGYRQADIILNYLHGSEKVNAIKAATYNKVDGVVEKKVVQPETIFEEQINEYFNRKKFTFPDVQVGSIIELNYEIEMPYSQKIKEWEYQCDIPTIYSEYSVTILTNLESYLITQGIRKFDVQKEEKQDVWENYEKGGTAGMQRKGLLFNKDLIKRTYGLRDIPAFGDESYITSKNDFIIKLEYKIATDREIEAKEFNNYANIWPARSRKIVLSVGVGGYLNNGIELAKKLIKKEFDFEGKSNDQKSREIISYVRKSYNWNGYFGKSASQWAESFIETKEGNIADINLFLIALLRAAGIDASPVALSTRKNGKINMQYPNHRDFNYLVVLVTYDGRQFLTDGTEKLLAYDKIPPHCINEKGLILSADKGGWVRLDNQIVSKDNRLITIDIDPNELVANTGVTIQGSEYNAYLYKKKWDDEAGQVEKEMLDKGFTKIDQVKSFNFTRNEKPYIVAFKGKYEIESISDKLIVAPFLQFVLKENPFKQKERQYPVDFTYISAESFKSQIIIPTGYTIDRMPEGVSLEDDIAKIDLAYQQSGNQVIVNGYYSFKKAVYQPEDYLKVKEHFEVIVNKFNQELVFDKL